MRLLRITDRIKESLTGGALVRSDCAVVRVNPEQPFVFVVSCSSLCSWFFSDDISYELADILLLLLAFCALFLPFLLQDLPYLIGSHVLEALLQLFVL